MNENIPSTGSDASQPGSLVQTHRQSVAYIGVRVDGRGVVFNRSDHQRLSPERSLTIVNHSPNGFDWGYVGSGPAQLACALLLDYYDDEQIARDHYIAFRNRVLSQLKCDGPAACWHLTGAAIDAAMATMTDDVVALPDGGKPSPTLPANWRLVTRPDRRVFQRTDCDHYIVLAEGRDEWIILLCSQGDRAYPAPLAVRMRPVAADPTPVVEALMPESNELVELTDADS